MDLFQRADQIEGRICRKNLVIGNDCIKRYSSGKSSKSLSVIGFYYLQDFLRTFTFSRKGSFFKERHY